MHQELKYRFGGIERLMGADALVKIQNSHVLVIGVGGVGSWACEALIRSGLGNLTMLDADDICITNTNRQIHTLKNTIGKSKVRIMKERLMEINPEANIHAIEDFLTEENLNELIHDKFDFVLDAIDRVRLKCLMLLVCRQKQIPLLMAGGAAGKNDPSRIHIHNLEKSINDMLLMKVKKTLRREFGFTKNPTRFKTKCLYSSELPQYPDGKGGVCEQKQRGNNRLDCRTGMGTATFVTGTFGFMAAAHIIHSLRKPNGLD